MIDAMQEDCVWRSECGTVEVVTSPLDAGVKVLHHGNGSVVWLSEAEAVDLACRIFDHCKIAL